MTAGSGIIHQELPRPFPGEMMGFQLWVNLPREKKMTGPRYMGLTKDDLETVEFDNGKVIVVAGTFRGVKGPVKDLFVDTEYFDVHIDGEFDHPTGKRTCFIYVYEGSFDVGDEKVHSGHCALLTEEGEVRIKGKGKFILVAGDPLGEPVAWGGPIVMNTQEELDEAFRELRGRTFIKE
jgi:redox-sensitive bicupin YhaK (pirin superfamily)